MACPGSAAPASTQTIGIVDAYDDPTAAADLEHYDSQFAAAACTSGKRMLPQINQEGAEAPLPPSNSNGEEPEAGWAQEDRQRHRGRPRRLSELSQSCSWRPTPTPMKTLPPPRTRLPGWARARSRTPGAEQSKKGTAQRSTTRASVITASAGDGWLSQLAWQNRKRGSPPTRRARRTSSAVGGTRLLSEQPQRQLAQRDGMERRRRKAPAARKAWVPAEAAAAVLAAAPWQTACLRLVLGRVRLEPRGRRRLGDADPVTGVAVYENSTENPEGDKGWGVIGGTSVASPIIASVFALAGGAQGVEYPARTLYENAVKAPASLHDVISGSNGECLRPFDEKTRASGCSVAEEAQSCAAGAICLAGPGYDGPSGVGTPNGIGAFQPSVHAVRRGRRRRSEPAARRRVERRSPSPGTTPSRRRCPSDSCAIGAEA